MELSIIFYIEKVVGLTVNGKEINPTIKIEHGRGNNAVASKKGLDHVLNFPYEFDYVSGEPLAFRVKNGVKQVGEVSVDTSNMVPEIVYSKTLELQSVKAKNTVTGTIHVRIVITPATELRTEAEYVEKIHYNYESLKSKFKSGDLILFGGRKDVDSLQKLRSGTNYSSVGMIVVANNQYTKEEELLVLDITSDPVDMVDAFNYNVEPGIKLFKLFDRLHYFYGSAIWWAPLKLPLDPERLQAFRDWVGVLHNSGDLDAPEPVIEPHERTFLSKRGFRNSRRNMLVIAELYSPQIILNGLKTIGLISGDEIKIEPESILPSDLLELSIYSRPRILKCVDHCLPVHASKKKVRANMQFFKEGPLVKAYLFSEKFDEPLPFTRFVETKGMEEEEN